MNPKSRDFSDIAKADIINMAKGKKLHGEAAVAAVEKAEGKLTPIQRHVVILEGYSSDDYEDTKKIPTAGVGQTGPYKNKPFKEVFGIFEKRVRDAIPQYDSLPLYLRKELVQSAYRGDLGFSPDTVKLFNKGNYTDAAKEFLVHEEYLSEKEKAKKTGKPSHIAERIEAASDAIDRYGKELGNKELGNIESIIKAYEYADKLPKAERRRKIGQTVDVAGSMVGLGPDREHTVQAGDTTSKVARELGVRVEDLGGLGENRDLIHPGQVLTAPPEEKTLEEDWEELKKIWGLYKGGMIGHSDVSDRIQNIMKPRD